MCHVHCSLNSVINMNSTRKTGKTCLRKTAGETSNFHRSHDQNTTAEYNQTPYYCIKKKKKKLTQSQTLSKKEHHKVSSFWPRRSRKPQLRRSRKPQLRKSYEYITCRP